MSLIALLLTLIIRSNSYCADQETLPGSGVLMRSGTGNYYPILKVLDQGTQFRILETSPGWVNIKLDSEETGWISSNSLIKRRTTGMNMTSDSSRTTRLKLEVDRTALGAMIKGLCAKFDVTDSIMNPFDSPRQINPANAKAFRKKMTPQDVGAPVSVTDVGKDMLPMYMAISPVLASLQVAGLDGKQLDKEPYCNQVLLWISECSGACGITPFVFVATEGSNAYCFPGGWIVLGGELYGLIENEAELAGIIAHELGHAVLDHGRKSLEKEVWRIGVNKVFQELEEETGTEDSPEITELENYATAILGITRRISKEISNEFQADSCAVVWLARSGYDPSALKTFLERLRSQFGDNLVGHGGISLAWLNSRDELDKRISKLKKHLKKYKNQIKNGKRLRERFEESG